MRALIVGGHGFIGGRLCAQLRDHPVPFAEVIPLSRRDGLDLCRADTVRKVLRELRPDTIFNCAAHGGSLHYVTEYAADVIHDNVLMALNVYRAASVECPEATIVNPLSNCSYPGAAHVHYEPDWLSGPVHESVTSYGNSRRVIFVISRCYAIQHQMRTANLLVPNCFGPGDSTDPNRTHALNGMIIRMLGAVRDRAPEFEIWGSGRPVREWGYVDDVARVLAAAPLLEADLNYPVNIAQNRGCSIEESAKMIAEETGFAGRLVFNARFADGAPRKVLDDRRFRSLFPDFEFTEHRVGVRATVAYYKTLLGPQP